MKEKKAKEREAWISVDHEHRTDKEKPGRDDRGRPGRWKIENEGFNNQKNEIYDIEHLNSRDSNAMKNHYLLTQIADIMRQLYLAWNSLVHEMGQSIKNTSMK